MDFVIGGDGSKLLHVQEMMERERLQSRVELVGRVPHDQVRQVLVRGRVFLNCSLTESFCIAILEAASCGLLVVSTNVGGVPEVLPPDMILLAEPNVASMVATIQQAVERQQQNCSRSDPWETHARVRRMYSWKRVAAETAAVYDTVLLQEGEKERKRLRNRLVAYFQSLGGGLSGMVACALALIVQMWLYAVEWWIPQHKIDRVPDLVAPAKAKTRLTTSL